MLVVSNDGLVLPVESNRLTDLLQPCNTNDNDRVREQVDHPIKPLAPLLLSKPANSFPFQRCHSTLEAFYLGSGRDYTGIKSVSLSLLSERQRQCLVNSFPMEVVIFHHSAHHSAIDHNHSLSLTLYLIIGLHTTTCITAAAGTSFTGIISH